MSFSERARDSFRWLLAASLLFSLAPASCQSAVAPAISASSASAPLLPAVSQSNVGVSGAKACPPGASADVCTAYKNGVCAEALPADICAAKISEQSISETLRKWFNGSGLLEATLGLLSAALLVLIAKLKAKLDVFSKRLGDPLIPQSDSRPFLTKGVNMLVIGEGGVGKTSLIRSLSGSPEAAPSRSTAMPKTYCIVHEVDVSSTAKKKGTQQRMLERVYANDYQGQRAEQLVDVKELHEREESIASTVLVLMVDLFEPPSSELTPRKAASNWQSKRVKEHLLAYPENALQMLIGLPNKLTQIVLFINKTDLLRPLECDTEDSIRKAYSPLIDRINEIGRQFDRSVVIGAASRGEGVVGFDPSDPSRLSLYEILKRKMVSIDT